MRHPNLIGVALAALILQFTPAYAGDFPGQGDDVVDIALMSYANLFDALDALDRVVPDTDDDTTAARLWSLGDSAWQADDFLTAASDPATGELHLYWISTTGIDPEAVIPYIVDPDGDGVFEADLIGFWDDHSVASVIADAKNLNLFEQNVPVNPGDPVSAQYLHGQVIWFPFTGPTGAEEWCVALRVYMKLAINETEEGAADGPIWSRSDWVTPLAWMQDRNAAITMAQLVTATGPFGGNNLLQTMPIAGSPVGPMTNAPLVMDPGEGSGSGSSESGGGVGGGGSGVFDPCQAAKELRKQEALLQRDARVTDCGSEQLKDIANTLGLAATCCITAGVGALKFIGPGLGVAIPACAVGAGVCGLVAGHVVNEVFRRCIKNAERIYYSDLLAAEREYGVCCTNLDNCLYGPAP